MTFAETEAALVASLAPLEGVERTPVRHMARAHHFAEGCFERAEEAAEAGAKGPWETDLRLATRLLTLFDRALAALERRHAQVRQEAAAASKERRSARFDHALGLAALADTAVARKAKWHGAPAETGPAAPAPAPAPNLGPPPSDAGTPRLSRQQRRALARRLKKTGGTAQGP